MKKQNSWQQGYEKLAFHGFSLDTLVLHIFCLDCSHHILYFFSTDLVDGLKGIPNRSDVSKFRQSSFSCIACLFRVASSVSGQVWSGAIRKLFPALGSARVYASGEFSGCQQALRECAALPSVRTFQPFPAPAPRRL